MRKTAWRTLVGVGAGLLLAGYSLGTLVGCSNSTQSNHPPISQLKEGVNIIQADDATWGMSAAYVKGGRVVYAESRVGPLKPEVYRQSWPDDPTNEMDFRFVDMNGSTIFVNRGGDNYVDPTWASDLATSEASLATISVTDRQSDWALAKEAAAEIAKALPASFQDHVFHLTAFASTPAPADDPALQTALTEMATKYPAPDRPYGSYSSGSWTQIYTAKYSAGTVCALWTCAASHSATAQYINPNIGAWELAISANNHGRAYNQMSFDCYSGGGVFTGGVSISGSTAGSSTGNSDGQGGCQTAYAWDSGGYNHLCNDDAAYELWQSKTGNVGNNGVWGTSGGSITFQWYGSSHCDGIACGQSPSYFACDCQSYAGCAGDWNTPNCP